MKFRIRILLFLTFVAAICFGLMTVFLPVGCIAAVPITIATVRTLRRSGGCSDPTMHSLSATFFLSLLLLVALTATMVLSISVSILIVLIGIVRRSYRIGREASMLAWQGAEKIHLNALLSGLTSSLVRFIGYLLAGTLAITGVVSIRLNRTSRVLLTHWVR